MMIIEKTIKTIFAAALGVFLLAGPVAFQQGCTMVECCCHPEETVELALEKGACCECCTMGQTPDPIQPIVEIAIAKPENIRPEIDFDSPEIVELFSDLDVTFGLIQTYSLSPPFIESRISAPLIC